MISHIHQPLLPLGADVQDVLENNVVWARFLSQFPAGLLDEFSRKYYAAGCYLNKVRLKRKSGRPRSRVSAERQVALAHVEAKPRVVVPSDYASLPPEALPAKCGRSPKAFHSMALAFYAVGMDGRTATPTDVFEALKGNPTLAWFCGFSGTRLRGKRSRRNDIPGVRTLQRFDKAMSDFGFWGLIKAKLVLRSFEVGALKVSDILCADTSHVKAKSSPRTVELPPARTETPPASTPPKPAPLTQRKVVAVRAKHNKTKQDRKVRKVRISRLSKQCHHADRTACNCRWCEGDAGSAVVVKSETKIFWAHKFSILGFACSTIPLDLAVVYYASMHDSTSLEPHLKRARELFPELLKLVDFLLADASYDDGAMRERLLDAFGLGLITKINPRARKDGAPLPGHEGRFTLSAHGVPKCLRGEPLVLVGQDKKRQEYLWQAPLAARKPLCKKCPFAERCGLRGARRTVRVLRAVTPQIDWRHPQHLDPEKRRYRSRTAVERQIERLKGKLNRDRLPCRGRLRVQAYLDRRLGILHAFVQLEHEHALMTT